MMDWLLWIAIAVAVLGAFVLVRARARAQAGITLVAPKVGFVNFGNGAFASLVDEDRTALTDSFRQVVSPQDGTIPTCDVLFVYASLSPDGSLIGAPEPTIRHVAARASAAVVVLAAPNSGASVVAAGKLPGPKKASLVFTIDRKQQFTVFFKELFSLMAIGKPMPLAWVTIAPQHASAMRPDMPETIFVPEAGAVRFQ